MAFVVADRVSETSTTTGTGTYDLAGAVTGFQTFVAGIGDNNTCPYFATMGADWEVGIGTVDDASPDTLARTTILKSSNANAAVSWAAGTKTISVGWPADRAILFSRTSLTDGDWFQYVSSTGLLTPKTTTQLAAAVGAVGGALAQAYAGYNTIGGSLEVMTSKMVYAKKITLASACLLTDIEAYVQNNAAGTDDQVESLAVALYADNSGTPSTILQYSMNDSASTTTDGPSMLLDSASGSAGDGVGRWLGVPIGRWLTAGDYWIAVAGFGSITVLQLAYDATGTDRHYTSGGNWFADWGFYSPTTSGNQYSIRANTVR